MMLIFCAGFEFQSAYSFSNGSGGVSVGLTSKYYINIDSRLVQLGTSRLALKHGFFTAQVISCKLVSI